MKKDVLEELSAKGYAILENVISSEECDRLGAGLDLLEEEHQRSQSGFLNAGVRQRQLLNVHYLEPSLFLPHISNSKILDIVSRTLNDRFILSNFNASRAIKSETDEYRIHIDSRKPNPEFKHTYQIVANICIDDFTEMNGGTVVVENSHCSGTDPRGLAVNKDKIKKVIAPKGSVVFLPGQTWHDIGHNRDGARRWSIIAYYACWWVKPTYDFLGACTKEIFDQCSDVQKELLGFTTKVPADWNKRQNTVTNIADLPKAFSEAIQCN
jgi:ectoine hydroxylase-related dioxygenase (phytanoyl-CoA dioxygenase family)